MTDNWIIEKAKEAENETRFGYLIHSPKSHGVNSPYGVGFIEGMVKYRESLWHNSDEKQPMVPSAIVVWDQKSMNGELMTSCSKVMPGRLWAFVSDLLPNKE